jgi:hypothetical protein
LLIQCRRKADRFLNATRRIELKKLRLGNVINIYYKS